MDKSKTVTRYEVILIMKLASSHRDLASPHRDLGVPHRDLSAG